MIEGNLVIENSHSLVSLGFFKKLRLVRNNPIGNEKYGIIVVGNENLRELFKQNVVIEHGQIFFHFNPKLCMAVIEKFKSDVVDLKNVSSFSNDEVSSYSNGDKAVCEIVKFQVDIMRIDHDTVVMQLTPPVYDNKRGQLLGYSINYMPAPYRNVTIFDGRSDNECDGDVWEKIDVPDGYPNRTSVTITLIELTPDTQYAYYIETNFDANGKLVGSMEYFQTQVAASELTPKVPVTASVFAETVSHLNMAKWQYIQDFIYVSLTHSSESSIG